MKKMYSTILLTMLMSMVGAKTFAQRTYYGIKNADGVTIYYEFINGGTELSVAPSGEYTGHVAIPEWVTFFDNTYRVTSMNNGAFFLCDNLTSVSIPNSVPSIGDQTFYGCI